MIFRKNPLFFDACIHQTGDDQSILAFALTNQIKLLLAVAHPLQDNKISQNAAIICKEFIQDRFMQLPTWMPHKHFSWSEIFSRHLSEIKQWLLPKETVLGQPLHQMIWLNWLVIVHPRTAFLLSIGEIHTFLFRQGEWRSWWEIPVDYAFSDDVSQQQKKDVLPSLCIRQMPLLRKDTILVIDQIEWLQSFIFAKKTDSQTKPNVAQSILNGIHQQIKQQHPCPQPYSAGLVHVF